MRNGDTFIVKYEGMIANNTAPVFYCDKRFYGSYNENENEFCDDFEYIECVEIIKKLDFNVLDYLEASK